MIKNIPISSEYELSGLKLLYLAWDTLFQTIGSYEESKSYLHEDDIVEIDKYVNASQTVLGNVVALVQQSVELSLKGRIAAISPYLLIARDPKDWPKSYLDTDIDFSEFRSIDAADLARVINTFSNDRMSDEFINYWNELRKTRNLLMHSVSKTKFKLNDSILIILKARFFVFNQFKWGPVCLDEESSGRIAILSEGLHTFNVVSYQFNHCIEFLSPSESLKYLGFDKKKRRYLCFNCYDCSNNDYETIPHLAQLESKLLESTKLYCIVCNLSQYVHREDCDSDGCKGNVIHDGMCLTCT